MGTIAGVVGRKLQHRSTRLVAVVRLRLPPHHVAASKTNHVARRLRILAVQVAIKFTVRLAVAVINVNARSKNSVNRAPSVRCTIRRPNKRKLSRWQFMLPHCLSLGLSITLAALLTRFIDRLLPRSRSAPFSRVSLFRPVLTISLRADF